MSHQTSGDECRQMQTSHRRMQTSHRRMQTSLESLEERRQVTRRVQTNADESLDDCRQMQKSVDESKKFSLIPEKITQKSPMLLLLQLCNSKPHRYANSRFYFVVLSVITAPQNVPTLHISKTHLPIVLLNVRELELN